MTRPADAPSSRLEAAVEEAWALLEECQVCPRACKAHRLQGEVGECGVGAEALLASSGPHYGEEAPLVGWRGSGTIFFGGCNLACLFCQNFDLSHGRAGRPVRPDVLARVMLALQEQGCHNVNLVTPTHVAPQIMKAILLARAQGLGVPIVYNCGGYESLRMLRLLEGFVEVYMPDFKYGRDAAGERLSGVAKYAAMARAAHKEMHRQVGDLTLNGRGLAVRGLLVRHLVLPRDLADSEVVFRFLATEVSPDTWVNVMAQYRPCYRADEVPELRRPPTGAEMLCARQQARRAGLHRGEGF